MRYEIPDTITQSFEETLTFLQQRSAAHHSARWVSLIQLSFLYRSLPTLLILDLLDGKLSESAVSHECPEGQTIRIEWGGPQQGLHEYLKL